MIYPRHIYVTVTAEDLQPHHTSLPPVDGHFQTHLGEDGWAHTYITPDEAEEVGTAWLDYAFQIRQGVRRDIEPEPPQ